MSAQKFSTSFFKYLKRKAAVDKVNAADFVSMKAKNLAKYWKYKIGMLGKRVPVDLAISPSTSQGGWG